MPREGGRYSWRMKVLVRLLRLGFCRICSRILTSSKRIISTCLQSLMLDATRLQESLASKANAEYHGEWCSDVVAASQESLLRRSSNGFLVIAGARHCGCVFTFAFGSGRHGGSSTCSKCYKNILREGGSSSTRLLLQ